MAISPRKAIPRKAPAAKRSRNQESGVRDEESGAGGDDVAATSFPSPVSSAPLGRTSPPARLPSVGILLLQLGTPDAPTSQALRPYLRQFLGDPRVIELPRWRWWPILQLILLRRPAASAAKYRRIWDPIAGSPLLHWTRRQAE